jgi:Rrf2 family protein
LFSNDSRLKEGNKTVNGVVKISEAASLALHGMAVLAGHPDEPFSTTQLAERISASEAHLSKVLQRLAKADLVSSTRGPGGGFKLSKPPNEISLLEIYEAIDGKLSAVDCLLQRKVCSGECMLGGLIERTNRQVSQYLSETKLSASVESGTFN